MTTLTTAFEYRCLNFSHKLLLLLFAYNAKSIAHQIFSKVLQTRETLLCVSISLLSIYDSHNSSSFLFVYPQHNYVVDFLYISFTCILYFFN